MIRVLCVRLVGLCLLLGSPAAAGTPSPGWTASWAAAAYAPEPQNAPPPEAFRDATFRQVFHLSIGGSRLRLRLTNEAGQSALVLDKVVVAPAARPGSAAVDARHQVSVTFQGGRGVTIPPGAAYLSDPIALSSPALGDVAVSIHLAGAPSQVTCHPGANATSWLIPGDHVGDADLPQAQPVKHWCQVAAIDVERPGAAAIVALGDSITDGHASTLDGNDRWPDDLARRLAGRSGPAIAVINEGIGGNHLLSDGLGPNVLARLDRDVLSQAGARWVILLEGVNDLGKLAREGPADAAARETLVAQIESAYQQVILRAHARGLRIYGATITPYVGSDYYHPGPEDEAARQAVNGWIRAPGHFDAVIDFDRVLRDPAHPDHLLARLDCGDHLHPSVAGYQAMADAVPLELFR